MRAPLVGALLAATACRGLETSIPARPASYGAFEGGEARQGSAASWFGAGDELSPADLSSNRLLSLEAEEVGGGLTAESQFEAPRAWWGKETNSFAGSQRPAASRQSEMASGAELKRMGHLMRRQLQPRAFVLSYAFYDPTPSPTGPSVSPTGIPSPMPTPLPSPLPTPAPSDLAVPTSSPAPTSTPAPSPSPVLIGPETPAPAVPGAPTASPAPSSSPVPTSSPAPTGLSDPPTTFDATQTTWLTSQITVSGIDDDDFADDGILVVQYSLNDVISFMESPEDVVDATVEVDSRRRRELLQSGNVTATIEYTVVLDTAATNGFTSTDAALESMEDEVSDAADSGYLAQRINYWSSYFGSDFSPDPDAEQDPDGFWAFAPSPAPTPFSPEPTAAPPTTPSPTASPAPSTLAPVAGPTISPTPAPSAPTLAPTNEAPVPPATVPTPSPGVPTIPPTPQPQSVVSVEPTTFTPPPTPAGGGGNGKKNNGDNAATLAIIIVCVIVGFLLLVFLGYMYMRNRERKLTERKDSWDISTMFTDEANLPDAEEMIDVEPEGGAAAEGADEADVSGAVLAEGAQGDQAMVALDEDQPQALQKITQAAEL